MKRPTATELDQAVEYLMPDVLDQRTEIVFSGINPSRYSVAVGHHFARPGNRFWPALHRAGFTPRQLTPDEDQTVLELGWGLTNIASRTTARADELQNHELVAGWKALEDKVRRWQLKGVIVVGVTAYRIAVGERRAKLGLQTTRVGGVPVWVAPNPSGLNAHYTLDRLADAYAEARRWAKTIMK